MVITAFGIRHLWKWNKRANDKHTVVKQLKNAQLVPVSTIYQPHLK